MSTIESTLDQKKNPVTATAAPDPISKTMMDLGEMFRESMKKYQAGPFKDSIIIRCETLPVIEGSKDQITQLFDNLVSMIFRYPPSGSKLFLYIDCDEMEPEKVKGGKSTNVKEYTIKFHTNISTNDTWKKENEGLIASCGQLVLAQKGTFGVNNINNTGCLFSLTFPGKLK